MLLYKFSGALEPGGWAPALTQPEIMIIPVNTRSRDRDLIFIFGHILSTEPFAGLYFLSEYIYIKLGFLYKICS